MYTTAFLDLPPFVRAGGTVRLPGSKSISNRVLLLAGLAEGRTTVHDLLASDDTKVMLDALQVLGCGLEHHGDTVVVTGLGGRLGTHNAALFLGNAGTAMRPLAAALGVLAATQGAQFELSGVARMHERPIGDLVDALRALGCPVHYLGEPGFPPLRVGDGNTHALDARTPLRVRGDVSSQFLTALLLAAPLLAHDHAVSIEVDGELISKPYVDITLSLLARFGIAVNRESYRRFTVPAGSSYRTPGHIRVEGDASSASYFVAMGAVAATEEAVRIEGMGSDSIQGDLRFLDAAQAMGAHVERGSGWVAVRRGAWPLRALTLDCNHIPDAAMTLAVMALYADGTSRLTGIGSWRVKETDRIAAMATELRKLGAHVVDGADFLEITPPTQWRAAALATYDDHRMAMCGSLAAFNAAAASPPVPVPVRIEDPRCVAKTFPDYFEALFALAVPAPGAVPVLTVDGPTASGKGTLAAELADRLGYHLLDSGALYRATALAAHDAGIPLDDGAALATLAAGLELRFTGHQVFLGGRDITHPLRLESTGGMASQVSVHPEVRHALHALQLSFRRAPGLVADGRDMGTVIFPDAQLKVFLTASAEARAERRYKQLISKGNPANIDSLRADLRMRDERDKSRAVAPLRPAEDAMLLDNSSLSIEDSVDAVLSWWQQRRPF